MPRGGGGARDGAVTGTVRDGSGALVLPGAEVTVTWESSRRTTVTGVDGRYLLCGLPEGETLVGVARFSGFSSQEIRFELSRGALQRGSLDLLGSIEGTGGP
ncbi:MAG: carboxypeptidase-like regulatory domain-containing protein [Gemmatimonadota bacterium]